MAEKTTSKPDLFASYRTDPVLQSLGHVERQVSRLFPRSIIPDKVKPHLLEWIVLRHKAKLGEIPKEEFHKLRVLFSDSHNNLFEDSNFTAAFAEISLMISLN